MGPKTNPRRYFDAGDLFFLSSREDPYPLVALEAADSMLPIVCFKDAGGIPEFVGSDCGKVISNFDVKAASEAIYNLINSPVESSQIGKVACSKVKQLHSASQVSDQIYKYITREVSNYKKNAAAFYNRKYGDICTGPLISCILPNYNHEIYITERLESIASQSYNNIELLALDDCSSDSSASLIDMFALTNNWTKYLPNSSNSGSTFKQWIKAMKISNGKYIWIAESDDSADIDFLANMVQSLEMNPNCNIATCMPLIIDINSNVLGTPNEWLEETEVNLWKSNFTMNGREFIEKFMIHKNYILNTSGVLIRNRPELFKLVDESMRLCGDWLFWSRLLMDGDIAFNPNPLNKWRQASSNARSKKAGELESREGKYIVSELSDFLGYSDQKKNDLLNIFANRCNIWSEQ